MDSNDQVFYGVGGGLFLIFSILSALVLIIACKICKTRSPSLLSGIGISLLLMLLFVGALIGGPYAFHELNKQFGEDKSSDFIDEQYKIGWSADTESSPLPMMKQMSLVLGVALPLLMLLGGVILRLSVTGVSYSQSLTLYFVYFLIFLLVFGGVFYGTTILWQQYVLSS